MTIWLISDTHFGHAKIIDHCQRPFKSVEEMDETMIENWNNTVKPQDHVYHLGDVCFGQATLHRVLRRLNGRKRLILGNHDNQAPMKEYAKYFEKILCWRLFKPYILTHVPIHQDSFGKAQINIHGHIHEKPAFSPLYRNVSVERIDYSPIALEAFGAFKP